MLPTESDLEKAGNDDLFLHLYTWTIYMKIMALLSSHVLSILNRIILQLLISLSGGVKSMHIAILESDTTKSTHSFLFQSLR
jgi:hypothetical protein